MTALVSFLKQRPEVADMLARGLARSEYINMDKEDAEKQIKKERKMQKKKLSAKLNHNRRPSRNDLEQRGIVPSGYFANTVGQPYTYIYI